MSLLVENTPAEQVVPVPTILDLLPNRGIRSFPYVYGSWYPAMVRGHYNELMMVYPTIEQVIGTRKYQQNARYDIDAVDLLRRDDIDPIMKEFIRVHTSGFFWSRIVDRFGLQIRNAYPDLEDQVGKSLDEFIVGVRNAKRDEPVDIELDAKPGYNTPPDKQSTVRSQHVDNPRELFAALLYCRLPEDDSGGGDFFVDKSVDPPGDWLWYGKNEIYSKHFENFQRVKYKANHACFFINGLKAVHHVTPREVTTHPRRLMNFLAEVRMPLFKIPKGRERPPKEGVLLNASHENNAKNVQRRSDKTPS